ncbi:DegT/DnrJ/EryC1/StrS family aminotransferase [Amycolatopsis suaedae]|uniref:DegT/DnrJ/EryC1/StrS family aminotransferase n=1 Tax=Amycolatopsis suaedae TaxID=2510978 RepID=A0A4Q7J186_9PSEU|nr:DegT/DnrJ/EryC1/StrS family aminotransferase [Amycolatopsis suaedae]RZQ61151.1 DegT/DnrJ/EryC1/StrS family aminotransferase [Amycolatopsis suaedae]
MTQYVWGYLPEYEKERDDILDAVDTVFRSGKLVLGPSVKAFEEEYAEYHGLAHCVGVDNGTNAIVLGLRALGVGRGDEVITVSNTAAPTVLAIDAVGATPVFVDIDPDTYLMRVDQVESVITERTKALLPVHLYGQCVDMAPLEAIAAKHGLPILEDCAQSHGARHHGRMAGTMGKAAAFSFYPTKVLGAYGDGGAVITDDAETDAKLRRLRYYGMEKVYYVVETPGYNSRLDEVQAEILRRKLTRLDGYLARRRVIAARYEEAFAGTELITPRLAPGNDHVYYVYVVRHPKRDAIIEALKEHDVSLNISYPWPVHTQSGFAHLGYQKGSLPVTEEVADQIFSLPMYASLSDLEQERVVGLVQDILKKV